MPSFLSKVFGRKKEDTANVPVPKGHKSNPSLLEGKFEAVVTPASPVATNFASAQQQPKDKDGGFGLFTTKSRQPNSPLAAKPTEAFPTLSLNFPGQKEENGTRVLGVVFEGDRQVVLDDSVIAAKRLTPTETLALVRACSLVITERGASHLSNVILFFMSNFVNRSRNSGDHAPPLAFCLARYPAPSDLPFHSIPFNHQRKPTSPHTFRV
jgi:hypothetical protein